MAAPDSDGDGNGDTSASDSLGSPDDDRGGATVAEAIAKAEAGSQVDGVHETSGPGDSGEARRAEIRDVEGATEGTVDRNPGGSAARPEPGPAPTEIGSAGAQRIVGARLSDRVAAGQPVPDGPPFDGDAGHTTDAEEPPATP